MQFDPFKLFERLWGMRGWGRVLMVITGITAFLFFMSFYTTFLSRLWIGAMLGLLILVVIIAGLEVTRRKKLELSRLIFEGEQIKARLTTASWDAVDRYGTKIDEWRIKVEHQLTEEEINLLKSNTGIEKPEDETIGLTGDEGAIQNALVVDRNYMHIRILRLKQIIEKL